MGMDGVALSYNIVSGVTLVAMAAMVWGVDAWRPAHGRAWPAWSCNSIAGWGQFLRVALPSLAMICADW